MASVQAPLSARQNSRLGAAGTTQVGGAWPRTQNPLLQRDDVGRAKPTCYTLPEGHFSYGKPGNMDMEGAREVSMRWVSHTPSRGPQDDPPDWIHHNKRGVGMKVLTSKDQMNFRREQGLLDDGGNRGSQTARARYHSMFDRDAIPSDMVPGFTYGRKVRPSTPIQRVIANDFGTVAEAELRHFYGDFHEAQQRASSHIRKIPLTAASRGHASAAKTAAWQQDRSGRELFKISKFRRASPKVDTRYRRQHHILDGDLDSLNDIATKEFEHEECSSTAGSGQGAPADTKPEEV